jgi:hypothetical protein
VRGHGLAGVDLGVQVGDLRPEAGERRQDGVVADEVGGQKPPRGLELHP